MKTLLSLLLLAAALVAAIPTLQISRKSTDYTLFFLSPNTWKLQQGSAKGKDVAAWGSYSDDLLKDGWGKFSIRTNATQPDNIQAYAAGYLEGALSWQQIDTFFNEQYFVENLNATWTPQLDEFLTQNIEWMRQQISTDHTDPVLKLYWQHAALILTQIEGMYAGYSAHRDAQSKYSAMKLFDFFRIQLDGDIETLESLFSPEDFEKMDYEQLLTYSVLKNRCSAALKYSNDKKELFVAQTTFDSFTETNRIFKHMDTPYSIVSKNNGASLQSFSSSPAWLASVDDYYLTNNGLIVIETTNDLFNNDLLKLITPKSALSWLRTTVANRMAKTGNEWSKIFGLYNSGTYNNQWMIVDTKEFVAGAQKQKDGLFIMVEQMPGYMESASLTSLLDEAQYWASYNVPYFPSIFNMSGYAKMQKKHGDDFGYKTCPRARIMARDNQMATTLDGMKHFIRLNHFQDDPLTKGDGCNSVAARCDLNPKGGKRHFAFGALDAKVTSVSLAKQMITHAQAGPTHYQQPVFEWSEEWAGENHGGLPQSYNFDWIELSPNNQ